MERMPTAAGHHIHDIHIADRARVQLGDHFYSGGLTINSKVAPLTDYTGFYAQNALAPVSAYVDRPELRGQLEEQFYNRVISVHHKTPTVVVHGIGGVGKTQLVLDYIQRHRQDYSAIFWIEAGSPETIQRDYVQIYVLLYSIPLEGEQDAIQVRYAVPAVKRWFYGRGKRWLFIFDNADSISNQNDPSYVDLRRFLPDDPSVHIIITTRDRSATEMTELPAVEVDEMRPEEAVTLFQRQARVHTTSSQQEEQIGAIVKELGYLALAITLAGSYVAATPRLRGDLARYLPEYRERRKDLLSQRPSWLVHQYGESLLTTWETTFRTMEGQSPEACQFLALLSFLNQDDIPVDFPTTWVDSKAPAWISTIFLKTQINQYDIEEFFRVLARFSFIKYREDQGSYSMHNLIQAWAYDRLEENQQRHYGNACALLLQAMTNAIKNAKPVTRGRFVPHVVSSFHKISRCFESASAEDEPIVDLLSQLAVFLDLCGQPKDEAAIKKFILRKRQSWYGGDHPDTLSSMNNLASTLKDVGELQEALLMMRVVFEKYKQILGEDHPHTLLSMNNLASTLGDVGELQQALSMKRAVFKKRQQILGEDHPDTLSSMNNLAITLGDVGELQEALSMKRVVFEKRQQILGEDHPDTHLSMNNLASTLADVGELQEALSMMRAVFEKRQQILGEDHPHTLSSMNNLANTLGDVGELQEALSTMRVVFEKRQKILGEDHPHTLSSMNNLANTLGDVGELQEALSMMRVVFEKRQQILGEDHPDTLSSMNNLASALGDVGELQKALSMMRVVLEKRQQILGEDHPDTLLSMNNLAITLGDVGELQEALSMMRVVFEKRQHILGEDHPDTLSSMNNLANTLGEVGELQEALSMMRAVFEKRQQILGEDHPHTLSSMNNLAITLGDVGELQQALSMKRVVFEKRQQILGEDHPDTLSSMNNLANTLGDVGELQEALSTMRVVFEKYKQVLGEDHPHTLLSMNNLASTLGEVGELQEALSMQRKVVEKMTEVLGAEHPYTVVSGRCLQQIEKRIEGIG